MRYIAFKWHRILINFDVVIAGKKNPAGESGEVKSIVVVINRSLLRSRAANPRNYYRAITLRSQIIFVA